MRNAITSLSLIALLTACSTATPPPTTTTSSSSYGTTLATAVEVCKPPGERKYLQRLRCADGSTPTFSRNGSGGSRVTPKNKEEEEKVLGQMFRDGPLAPGEPDYHIVDYYEVRCGDQATTVIMDMYHCQQEEPTQAPPGFTIVQP